MEIFMETNTVRVYLLFIFPGKGNDEISSLDVYI